MRICLYSEKVLPKIGGQELVVDAIARNLVDLGHEPVVLAPNARGKTARFDRELPYRVVRHPRFYSTRRFVDLYRYWLARAQRRYRFDVVHCHGVYPTGYIAARCAAVANIPVVITSHGGDVDPVSPLFRKPGLKQRYQHALKNAQAVVALSGFMQSQLEDICPEIKRIDRIGNGVNLDEFEKVVDTQLLSTNGLQPHKYFLFLGRLVPRKGADLLVEAFASLSEHTDITLAIAGSGRQQPSLQERVAELGMQQRVKFVGEVDGPQKTCLLQNARCVVMPSRISEAFGMVALEAFAAARPVIATNIPGLAELVEPERTGMLFEEDSLQSLAQALSTVAAGPELMDRLGGEARRQAQAYSWANVTRRHVELYEDLSGSLSGLPIIGNGTQHY